MAGVKTLQAAIEAILFTMGESVELSKIAKAIEQDEQTTEELLQDLMKKYESKNRGIRIIELDKSYQMCTKKEYGLVEEVGRLDAPGRPILFGTTEEFLRRFSVPSIDDLPSLNPEQLEHFKEEAEDEAKIRMDI